MIPGLRSLIVLCLLALSCAVVSATPAQAAGCEASPLSFPALLEKADVVVTGTIAEIGQDAAERPTYTVKVSRIYRGEIGAEVVVHGPQEPACALDAEVGQEWLVMARGDKEPFAVRKDTGSRPLTESVGRVVASKLGSGTEPEPSQPAQAEVAFTDADADEATKFWPLALPGVAIAGFGVLALLVSRALSGGKERP